MARDVRLIRCPVSVAGMVLTTIASGIHWHMNLANEIEYIASDRDRQVIQYVGMKDRQGAIREYVAAGVNAEQAGKGERHPMDCTDCHNRLSHEIDATPEPAVNAAMARGELPKDLPFLCPGIGGRRVASSHRSPAGSGREGVFR